MFSFTAGAQIRPFLTRCLLVAGLFGLVAVVPAADGRSVYRVDARGQITLGLSGVGIELTGTPFKRCRGSLESSGAGAGILRARCTHGKIVVRTKDTNADGSRGTWRVVAGSGRYRHAKGSGRYSGSFVTLRIRFRGTARF